MLFYLFRALNQNDVSNIKNGIQAKKPCKKLATCLQCVTDHIKNGSNSNGDCWISASKDFEMCASEFAIPQSGNYNTAITRKPIAIIDVSTAPYSRSKIRSCLSWTMFSNVIDFSANIPIVVQTNKNGRRFRTCNGANFEKSMLTQHIKTLNTTIQNSSPVSDGMLDCSLPTTNDRKFGFLPLNEMSLLDLYKSKLIGSTNINGIYSGIAKVAKEVLILNRISINSIVKVLSDIEIDIVYAANAAVSNNNLMSGIISGKIWLTVQGSTVLVNQVAVKSSGVYVPLCADKVITLGSTYNNIETIYGDILDLKRQVIYDVLVTLGLANPGKSKCSNYKQVQLPENNIWVIDADIDQAKRQVTRSKRYDLLAIKNGGKIYGKKDAEFNKLCKTFVKIIP